MACETRTNEIGSDLVIRKTTPREGGLGGTWVDGTIAGHRFQVLVFEDHVESDEYELETSRISKLWLQRETDHEEVANFDRGWDVEPTTGDAETIVDFLCAGIAVHTFGR
jgi:hypothetical protein